MLTKYNALKLQIYTEKYNTLKKLKPIILQLLNIISNVLATTFFIESFKLE